MRRQQLVIDDTGSVEDIHTFIYCKKWKFGRVSRMPHSLTDSHLKDRATQLLIKYKSGALATQYFISTEGVLKLPKAYDNNTL